MKTINVYKAQPFTKSSREVESVTINIHEVLPEVLDLNLWARTSKAEAAKLADALCTSLPQGVTDALLVELLDLKRSSLVVPMDPPSAEWRRVFADDLEGVAAWCGGAVKGTRLPPEDRVIDIQTDEGEIRAAVGDYIVKQRGDFSVYSEKRFKKIFGS